MSIDAKDLRIGNWVEKHNYGTTGNMIQKIDGAYISWVENGSSKCFGIPLTPELLEKCGFEQYENTSQSCLTFKNLTIEKDGDKWNWTIRYASGNTFGDKTSWYYHHAIPIQYIHQLQNLYYCLTGTELEINL